MKSTISLQIDEKTKYQLESIKQVDILGEMSQSGIIRYAINELYYKLKDSNLIE